MLLFIPLQRRRRCGVSGILFLNRLLPILLVKDSLVKRDHGLAVEDRRVCPSCGNEFSGAVEFCPVCMLHKALEEDVESGESTSEPGQAEINRKAWHDDFSIMS